MKSNEPPEPNILQHCSRTTLLTESVIMRLLFIFEPLLLAACTPCCRLFSHEAAGVWCRGGCALLTLACFLWVCRPGAGREAAAQTHCSLMLLWLLMRSAEGCAAIGSFFHTWLWPKYTHGLFVSTAQRAVTTTATEEPGRERTQMVQQITPDCSVNKFQPWKRIVHTSTTKKHLWAKTCLSAHNVMENTGQLQIAPHTTFIYIRWFLLWSSCWKPNDLMLHWLSSQALQGLNIQMLLFASMCVEFGFIVAFKVEKPHWLSNK